MSSPGDRRTAADEFALRYYRWALDDARREVEANFPLLRNVKSSLPMRAVAFLESMPGPERLAAMTALVKRNHRRGVALTGDSWDDADEARIDQDYRNAARIWPPEEEWYRHAMLHDPAKLKLDRRRFLAAVKTELAPVFGPGQPFSTAHEWRYETPIGPWALLTFIDVGGSVHQLAYTQTIRVDPAHVLKEGLSICGWLGIGTDTAAAARSLASVCAHFLPAARELVTGLAPHA